METNRILLLIRNVKIKITDYSSLEIKLALGLPQGFLSRYQFHWQFSTMKYVYQLRVVFTVIHLTWTCQPRLIQKTTPRNHNQSTWTTSRNDSEVGQKSLTNKSKGNQISVHNWSRKQIWSFGGELHPCEAVKNLGVLFAQKWSSNEQFSAATNRAQQPCGSLRRECFFL